MREFTGFRPEGARRSKPAHDIPRVHRHLRTLALLLMNMVSRAQLKSASVYEVSLYGRVRGGSKGNFTS